MNKSELIESVAKVLPTKKDAASAVDTVFDAIKSSLKKGNPVTLIGFGTFKVSKRKARTGRNPQTGESIKIPAKNIPVFKAGSELKKAVK
ncbi:MAG: HU family DNA-binding protein [Candidatus Omnitrophica bacterium]|jgi:nucleoid DNA-binding protein|nr:HU family DNA-binding protein [Candidatus Omnitrophota bacterium]